MQTKTKNKTKNNNTNKNKVKTKIIYITKPARKRTTRRLPRTKKNMPAAQTNKLRKDFRILYQDGNTVKVTGRDLIYKIPNDITSTTNNIITCIPANPAYWTGTRIAALAQGYQNYRPLAMQFNYIPQCAVTQQGNVLCGTLWNQAPTNENLQQSLRTSNGGALSQCYSKFTSTVRMKSNLQYNLYRMGGQFDQESNPFIFLALALGCKNNNSQQIIPGYFYVTWSFILKNPIGAALTYGNTGLIMYKNINTQPQNKTIVYLMQDDNLIKCGSILQLEDEDDKVIPKYNGSITAPNENDYVWQFYNNASDNITRQVEKEKEIIYYDVQGIQEGSSYYAKITEAEDKYTIQVRDASTISQNTDNDAYYITILDHRLQNYGTLTQVLDNMYMTFTATKERFELLPYYQNRK